LLNFEKLDLSMKNAWQRGREQANGNEREEIRKNACPSVWNGKDKEEDTQQVYNYDLFYKELLIIFYHRCGYKFIGKNGSS
jgi:hypothetical protein